MSKTILVIESNESLGKQYSRNLKDQHSVYRDYDVVVVPSKSEGARRFFGDQERVIEHVCIHGSLASRDTASAELKAYR